MEELTPVLLSRRVFLRCACGEQLVLYRIFTDGHAQARARYRDIEPFLQAHAACGGELRIERA